MKKPILRRLNQTVNGRFINMYDMEYDVEDKDGKVTSGKWTMVSRKKLPALTKSFLEPRADAVVVMALVAEEGADELKLLVTGEYRHPIQNIEYGFVAGLIDGEETAESAARRELKEEAGLTLEKVLEVSPPIVSSAGLSDESVQIVICLASGKLSTAGNEAAEIIEPMLLDYEGVRRLCDRTGEFENVVIAAKAWPLLYMIRQMGRITTGHFLPPPPPGDNMIVHVESIRNLIAQYRAMMDLDPAKVELYENGERVVIPEQFIKDWKFCGLGFGGFIETEFYKTGFVDDEGNPSPLVKDTDDRTGTETTGG